MVRGLIVAALVLTGAGMPSPAAASVHVGASAPALTLPGAEGRPIRLDAYDGRVVLVDFWASWCAHCAQALPALDALARREQARGLVVLGVGIDTDATAAARFLAARLPHPTLTLLRDPGGRVLADLGLAGLPALYVVDRRGVVRLVEAGYTPDRLESIGARVVELLEEPAEPGTSERRRAP